MAELRFARGWTEPEIEARLAGIASLPRNYEEPPEAMTVENGWNHYFSEAIVGHEAPGPVVAGGPFERGQQAVAGYSFSDPRIVIAHFDPEHALLGRRMLLELRALRVLHYLSGVVVGAVQDERDEERSVFGFRYDTLEGHLEAGAEWFLLTKQHATGEIRFRIEASWRPGQFPNLWSRLGFYLLGPIYQEIWHRRAHAYLARLLRDPDAPAPEDGPGRLVHSPPKVVFERTRGKRGGVIGDW